MTKLDFSQLFDNIDRLAVGFTPMFRSMQSNTSNGYPPYNVIKHPKGFTDGYTIEMAVAGFKKDQISIELLDNELTVKGNRYPEGTKETDSDMEDQFLNIGYIYQHQGISKRSFKRSLLLAEHIEVSDVRLEDGILYIDLLKNIPEAQKPKTFKIK